MRKNRDCQTVPTTLYKYRCWCKETKQHTKSLLSGELYFSSRFQFNDPFELEWLPQGMSRSEANLVAKLIANPPVDTKGPELNEDMQKLILEALPDRLMKPIEQKDWMRDLGIFCAARCEKDIRMWSHYGGNHTGICVGFRADCFGTGNFRRVNYCAERPSFDLYQLIGPPGEFPRAVLKKSDQWTYEDEYRTFRQSPGAVKIGQETITEVVFGCKTSDEHRQEIMDHIETLSPCPNLFNAVMSKTTFAIDIEPVE